MRIKKARILLRNLYKLYEVSEYKKDYAFFVLEGVFKGDKKYYSLFNGKYPQINECYLTITKGQKKIYICYHEKIIQLLNWLGIAVLTDNQERNTKKKFIRLKCEINREEKKVNNY